MGVLYGCTVVIFVLTDKSPWVVFMFGLNLVTMIWLVTVVLPDGPWAATLVPFAVCSAVGLILGDKIKQKLG
jgi:hypothetical protein